MMIIGCDLHTRYQQVAMVDTDTGEMLECRLEHANGEARAFYVALSGPVRVGIEETGYTHWFEALLAELVHELWTGDAARIWAAVVRKQKTDARDAAHLLDLLAGGRPFQSVLIFLPQSEFRVGRFKFQVQRFRRGDSCIWGEADIHLAVQGGSRAAWNNSL